MSGVVYGLLGYIWMKGKYDPGSRLFLHKTTVAFMISWYFLCFTGMFGPIANGAHTAGLVIGVAWGFISSPKFRQLIKQWKK
jgi:membrane associated rhomboid family serine protease